MEIHQLKTFVAVAREGSITRASERLFLSQPAVSAHVKTMEDMLGITLFERTVRGMTLTSHGQRILTMAERTLEIHRELVQEASRIKGRLAGKLRIGVGGKSSPEALGRLVRMFSEHHPEVEVSLQHLTSADILDQLRAGALDAGFYNEGGTPDPDLAVIEIDRFPIYVAAPRGMVDVSQPLDWAVLRTLPWIFPQASHCCGSAAEHLFKTHHFRPSRVISIDRESVTLSMLSERVGLGLLHGDTALEAQRRGEIDILCEAQPSVRNLFAHLASRTQDPLFRAARAALIEEPAALAA